MINKEENKVFIEVMTRTTADGICVPTAFLWEDQHYYSLEAIKDWKHGGFIQKDGTRMYTCVLKGQEIHLYHEEDDRNRWFMYRKYPKKLPQIRQAGYR